MSQVSIGLDIGGTKINMRRSDSNDLIQFPTEGFACVDDVLSEILDEKYGPHPSSICIGIAAVKNHIDGSVTLVKRSWPTFYPVAFQESTGIITDTSNDMITSAVGAFEQENTSTVLKVGGLPDNVPSLIYSWSTGIGTSIVIPSGHDAYYLPSASGHAGIAPKSDLEFDYVNYIRKKHLGHLSLEFAVGGDVGLTNLIEYFSARGKSPSEAIAQQIMDKKEDGQPIGKTLLEYVQYGNRHESELAREILELVGGLMGYALRNQVLAVDVGSIKMTGSVAQTLLPYLVNETEFIKRFIDKDARCAYIPAAVTIELIENPNIAVDGALIIAEKALRKTT